MDQGLMTAAVAVAAVALLSVIMRRSRGEAATYGTMPPPAAGPDDAEEEVGDRDTAEAVAITSDGWSFVPIGDRDRVRLIPPLVPREGDPVAPRPAPEQLARGDLIAARVKRGAPDHDPWRLEALGRDRDYRAWRFETEEAARAALALVSRSIVVTPRDEDGADVLVGDEDFAAARRREEEIEAELATMTDVEERAEDATRRPLG